VQLILALAIATGSWVYVPGGTWQPGQTEVADAKARLYPYIISEAKARKATLPPWNEYTFQYPGRRVLGRNLIYVNAFCSEPPEDVARNIVFVFDGGACYFEAYYDPRVKSFVSVRFNGLA
jgi:hypothetical protein